MPVRATAATVACLVALAGSARGEDLEGAKDHPLISRYPGSWIVDYSAQEYESFALPLGKVAAERFEKSQALEGKLTRIRYQAPADRSSLEVFRNYQGALIKAGSEGTLQEIARLLQQKPALRLYVVGHTDGQGSLESNLDLSRRRAAAVVRLLREKHGVAASRLSAQGDGPTAPVASNDDEAGRARNRRVELVKQ